MPKVALIPWPSTLFTTVALGNKLGLQVITAGTLFREHSRQRTPQGLLMEPYLQAGEFMPEELAANIVADSLANAGDGWVLYGYPMRIGHARLLTQHGHEPDLVVELGPDTKLVLLLRIVHRWGSACRTGLDVVSD